MTRREAPLCGACSERRDGMRKTNGTSAMVALIKASACEPMESRRVAAGLLLELLRSTPRVHDLRDGMARIVDEAPSDVSCDVLEFVEQLGLGGPTDLLP